MCYRYSAANGIGKGPAYSLSGRTEAKMESAVPGPGAYTHGEHIGKGPAFSMSGRTRTNLATDSPGPAAYASDTMVGKGPSFSLSGRPDSKMDTDSRMFHACTILFIFNSPLVQLVLEHTRQQDTLARRQPSLSVAGQTRPSVLTPLAPQLMPRAIQWLAKVLHSLCQAGLNTRWMNLHV